MNTFKIKTEESYHEDLGPSPHLKYLESIMEVNRIKEDCSFIEAFLPGSAGNWSK